MARDPIGRTKIIEADPVTEVRRFATDTQAPKRKIGLANQAVDYSLEKAEEFLWASTSGVLPGERLTYLRTYLTGKKILDTGCGGGAYVSFLSRQGLKVTGVDRHEEFLRLARENDPEGSYLQSDITSLPFHDKSFESAYCLDVMEHVDDRSAITELARVTRKRLIIAVPKKDEVMKDYGLTFFTHSDPTHLRYYSEAGLKELVSTIPHTNLHIFPELLVEMKKLVNDMIEFDRILSVVPHWGPFGRLKNSDIWVNNLIKRAEVFVLRRLLDRNVRYKGVYTGLVAVVDLEP